MAPQSMRVCTWHGVASLLMLLVFTKGCKCQANSNNSSSNNGTYHQIAQGQLKLFDDFKLSNYSTTGTTPVSLTAHTWTIDLDGSTQCSSPSSTLLLELWLTDHDSQPLPPGRTVDGLYFMASRKTSDNPSPPRVSLSTGGANFTPSLLAGGADPGLSYTYIDLAATRDDLTMHRILLPVGNLIDTTATDFGLQTWFLSFYNSNPDWLPLAYQIRATCMPAEELPCPRPSSSLWECGTAWPVGSTPTTSNSTCIPDPAGSAARVCACSAASAGPACNIPVTDLSTSNGTWQALNLQGSSWLYLMVNVPPIAGTRLLVELSKPLGSAGGQPPLQRPVLVVSNRSLTASSPVVAPLPGVSSIDPISLNIEDDCTLNVARALCFIPYQAVDLNYEMRYMYQDTDVSSWWIGVYNAVPYGNVGGATLMLRARWTSGSNGQPGPPLCPADCSGHGVCSSPTPLPPQLQQSLYSCTCNTGYGGPYCQGSMTNVVLDGNDVYFTNMITMSPGQWDFYTIQALNTGNTLGDATIAVRLFNSPANVNMLVIFAPMYQQSFGSLYFLPQETYVVNSSRQIPVPMGKTPQSDLSTWTVGVLNSGTLDATATGTYSLSFFLAVGSTGTDFSAFASRLQMGIIGTVAGLVMLLLAFLAFRVFMIRRALSARSVAASAEMTAAGGSRAAGASVPGVPAHVIVTFPVFKYEAARFNYMRRQNELSPPDGVVSSKSQAPLLQQQAGSEATAPAKPADVPAPRDASEGSGSEEDEYHDLPQCSVCISNYEEGEELRRLPCMHVFHQTCIDQWMVRHNTCPNCRRPLCPPQPGETRRHRRRARDTAVAPTPRLQPAPISPMEVAIVVQGEAPAAQVQQQQQQPMQHQARQVQQQQQ